MKKTITTTIAALFITTSLVGPAAANDDAIRLGLGIGGMILGEMINGGGNRQAQPRKGDKLEGRVDGKPIRQGSQQTAKTKKQQQQSKEAEKAEWAARFPVPNVGPVPEAKPTPEQMTAWLAAAPEREAQEEAAEAEMAAGPVVATDETTAAAVEVAQASQPEEAMVELFDNTNQSWGKVTPTQAAKAEEFARLGMSRADSYRAIGLRGPMAAYPEWDGKHELRDENGRVWGRVDVEVMERVAKAVEMGMPASKAIPALTSLVDPDVVAAKAKADAETAMAEDEKTRAKCIQNALDQTRYSFANIGGRTKYVECRPYEDEIVAAIAKAEADRKAKDEVAVAQCVENYSKGKGYDCPFHQEEFRAAVANLNADPAKRNAFDQAVADKDAAARNAEAQAQLNGIFEDQPTEDVAENETNQTAAVPIAEDQKPAIDEANKTAAIEADPKPVEQQPAKIKPKKLDL